MAINLSNFLISKSKNKRMLEYQDLDHIDGVSISTVSANLYKNVRDDLIMFPNPLIQNIRPKINNM